MKLYVLYLSKKVAFLLQDVTGLAVILVTATISIPGHASSIVNPKLCFLFLIDSTNGVNNSYQSTASLRVLELLELKKIAVK